MEVATKLKYDTYLSASSPLPEKSTRKFDMIESMISIRKGSCIWNVNQNPIPHEGLLTL